MNMFPIIIWHQSSLAFSGRILSFSTAALRCFRRLLCQTRARQHRFMGDVQDGVILERMVWSYGCIHAVRYSIINQCFYINILDYIYIYIHMYITYMKYIVYIYICVWDISLYIYIYVHTYNVHMFIHICTCKCLSK